MKQKIKISILSILLLSSLSASAFTFATDEMFKNPLQKFFDKVKECTWHVSCYTSPKVGAFTDLTTGTVISSFPAVYNANLVKTMEVGTTSVASITTLSGLTTANSLISATSLASIGTITTGQWNATAIPVNKGGTGTTSPTANLVLVGNGASGIKNISGTGSSGQFLTSNGAGADPSWQSSTVNQNNNYAWTGTHSFSGTSLFTASSTHSATTTISASSVTNNALVLNGANTQWPSSNNEGVIFNNGSGIYASGVACASGSFTDSGASTQSAATTTISHGLGGTPHYYSFSGNNITVANYLSVSSGYGTTTNSAWASTGGGQSSLYNAISNTTVIAGATAGRVLSFSSSGAFNGYGISYLITALTPTTFDISRTASANQTTNNIMWTMCK